MELISYLCILNYMCMKKIDVKGGGETIANPNNKDVFNRYLFEISKLKPLTREEETILFKHVELGNQEAIDKIYKHNLLFVVSVAKKYGHIIKNSRLTLEDLIGDGNIGLYTAIAKFDYNTGNKFISYAIWWIRQYILKSIQDNIKTIRIPVNVRSTITKYNRNEIKLEQELNRQPTTLEVFEAMVEAGEADNHKSVLKVDDILKANIFETSLSSFVSDDSLTELHQTIKCDNDGPEMEFIEKERTDLILSMLDKLPEKIKLYIYLYFGLNGSKPLSYVELGKYFNENPATIKLRMSKYLRKVRWEHKSKEIFFYPNPYFDVNSAFK